MTRAHLRTDLGQRMPAQTTTLLDWLPGDRRATVQSKKELLQGIVPTRPARDLLRIAVASYVADRVAPRAWTADSWTRWLELSVPVSSGIDWATASEPLRAALDFLSGDHWGLRFRGGDEGPERSSDGMNADAVCLFSGGLDSLAGAIDLLEEGKCLVLVAHYEGGLAPDRQKELHRALAATYGRDAVQLRQLFLRPAPPNSVQVRPLTRARENTTRSRSLLFIAAGLAVASALGPRVPLYVPENGYIGINVPLTWSRPASLSTRTTHPYFLDRLRAGLATVGLENPLENPYRLMTKGELLAGSRNPKLLARLAPRSLSCAHPEAARWAKRKLGNCGYCYPCLIRRAALHAVGQDKDEYAWDLAREPEIVDAGERGASVRALVRTLSRPSSRRDVLRNGPIPDNEDAEFAALYERGRDELRQWLAAAGGPAISTRVT